MTVQRQSSIRLEDPIPASLENRDQRERPGEPGWTQSVQHEHSGREGGPVQVTRADLVEPAAQDDDRAG